MDSRPEVFVENSRRIAFTSNVNGRQYAITLALPFGPPPPGGYEALYVLDPHWYFASAVEAVRSCSDARNMAVIGVGYPDDPSWAAASLSRRSPIRQSPRDTPAVVAASALERWYDFTLPASEDVLSEQNVPGLFNPKPTDVGGLDAFLCVLESEIKSRVASMIHVDASGDSLFGHSLGGLAVIRALLVKPDTFRTFIASSPAIWWNRRSVLDGRETFAAAVATGIAQPRVLITVGGNEERLPRHHPGLALDSQKLKERITETRMVANALELSAWIENLPGKGAWEVHKCMIFDEVGHSLAPWCALAHAVAFAATGR